MWDRRLCMCQSMGWVCMLVLKHTCRYENPSMQLLGLAPGNLARSHYKSHPTKDLPPKEATMVASAVQQ
jgi:hypothetical protein